MPARAIVEISTVIPSYNSARFLRQCIDSVLCQTHPVAEILVVDDGSDDQTKEVVESYPHPVRYFWRTNGGLSAARNTGVQQATCPWIAFLDADDWWTPEKIALQVKALQANPDAVLCYTGMQVVDSSGVTPQHAFPVERLWPSLRYQNPITPSTVMMRKYVFEELGGFDPKLAASQDWDLWFRLGPGRKVVAVDEPVTMYRITRNSLSSDVDRMLGDVAVMLDKVLLKDLRGWSRWSWGQRAWSGELSRCAVTAWEAGDPRARSLLVRSLMAWPSPFFLPRRWKSLAVYLSRRCSLRQDA